MSIRAIVLRRRFSTCPFSAAALFLRLVSEPFCTHFPFLLAGHVPLIDGPAVDPIERLFFRRKVMALDVKGDAMLRRDLVSIVAVYNLVAPSLDRLLNQARTDDVPLKTLKLLLRQRWQRIPELRVDL